MVWLLVTDNVPSSPILVTLKMEVICSSETSLARATWRHIPKDSIHQDHGVIVHELYCPEGAAIDPADSITVL
jgi:hypothetical protein